MGLGHWSLERRPAQREGVLHIPGLKVDALFVTLQKTEEDYSPTTMYEDYLISHDRFHWQSQSNTAVESPTGQRYINHQQIGYTPLLFVRETKSFHRDSLRPITFSAHASMSLMTVAAPSASFGDSCTLSRHVFSGRWLGKTSGNLPDRQTCEFAYRFRLFDLGFKMLMVSKTCA